MQRLKISGLRKTSQRPYPPPFNFPIRFLHH